jgi:undecaprenyl diphosphate synthase
MDGNGRWATKRGLPRTEGHRQGLSTAKKIVFAAASLGISYLSLFTFSTENWKRAKEEVNFLMGLIGNHLSAELDFYRSNRIRVLHSGRRDELSPVLLDEIDTVVRDTSSFNGLTVNLAINYGGRDEILRALRRLRSVQGENSEQDLTEMEITRNLDNPEIPDPDLIIRTGGELRLSNFLLWQSAYSELFFSDQLWPDFTEADFMAAIQSYSSRIRRFGGAT